MDSLLADMRRDYSARELNEADVDPDPINQFRTWFQEAVATEVLDPNAMALATAGRDGRPAVRIVLLKEISHGGFVFFTNYESSKGRDLLENPYASLCFWWGELMRQVRIEGKVERVLSEESDAYFASRPLESRLAAWASDQSSVIADRPVLEHRMQKMKECYADEDVPRPPYWGGYRLIADSIEFWQGRPSRLHDRLQYRMQDGTWTMRRLAP